MGKEITKATVNSRQVWRVYYHQNNGISKDFQSKVEAMFYAKLPYFETEKYTEKKAVENWEKDKMIVIKAPKFDYINWKFDHSEYWFYRVSYNVVGDPIFVLPYQKWNFNKVNTGICHEVTKTFLSKYCRLVTIFPGEL
jgi:hypothetical protein